MIEAAIQVTEAATRRQAHLILRMYLVDSIALHQRHGKRRKLGRMT